MTDNKKTFLKTVVTMLLSYIFAVLAIIFFVTFFFDIINKPVSGIASFAILSSLLCCGLFIACSRWSENIQRKWDKKQYKRWR